MFQRILVPTDGTELCAPALETALALAALGGGAIVGMHAVPALPSEAQLDDPVRADWLRQCEREGLEALDYVMRRARETGTAHETAIVHDNSTADAIVGAARDHHCDLIVMASRNGGRLGSVTWKVLERCAIPVLVVR